MPEARLERTRHPTPQIPPCVRLGHENRDLLDLGLLECIRCGHREDLQRLPWRPPHVNAAEQLAARADAPIRLSDRIGTEHWNTIEGQDH